MTDPFPRWEGDTRGQGVSNGAWIQPRISQLASALQLPDWIAEQPEDHLLPPLLEAIQASDSLWSLVRTTVADDIWVVDLQWRREHGSFRGLRADVFSLIGHFAESVTFVHQIVNAASIEFHITTGMLDMDGPFRGHGHLIQLRIDGPAIDWLFRS